MIHLDKLQPLDSRQRMILVQAIPFHSQDKMMEISQHLLNNKSQVWDIKRIPHSFQTLK